MDYAALIYKVDDPRQSTRLEFQADTDREAFDYVIANKPKGYRISFYGPVGPSVYRGR